MKSITANSYKKCFKIDWSRSSIEALRGAYRNKQFPEIKKPDTAASRSQSTLQSVQKKEYQSFDETKKKLH